jgi:hypothetical protein
LLRSRDIAPCRHDALRFFAPAIALSRVGFDGAARARFHRGMPARSLLDENRLDDRLELLVSTEAE